MKTTVEFEYLPDAAACLPGRLDRGGLSKHSDMPLARVYDNLQLDDLMHSLELVVAKFRPAILVLGTSSDTGTARVVLASFARKVALKTGFPTLLVGPSNELVLKRAGRWEKILAATDFTPQATEGLLRAHELAGAHLIALHCVPKTEKNEAHRLLERLRMLAPFNESHTVPVQHFVPTGNAAEQIVSVAKQTKPDLIVLGSPISSRENTTDGESVICSVVKEVQCPVLLMSPQAWTPAGTEAAEASL
ncbi:universal stress protein [Silvibacterium acidisoli]|uniref:universal stress protein n=1 Tax=Acidobacteriaceae bacterium ZG23-2 TaxID=2883246 RepID=UPI00406C7031